MPRHAPEGREDDGPRDRLPDSDGLRNPLFESVTVRQVFQEGAVLQERGVFGGPLEQETPLRPGGLVASDDGLTWRNAPQPPVSPGG